MRRKGLMSFVALILIIIASMFVFYFINMNETHSVSLFVKHNLDRSTKAAAMTVDETLIDKGVFKIDATESAKSFESLLSLNLGLTDEIVLNPIKQKNGSDYVFSYTGGEVFDDLIRLNRTPKITYFVFNASNERVTNNSSEVENFISEIRFTLNDVGISEDQEDDKAIKNAVLTELTGKNINGVSTGRTPQIEDTRSFVLAVSEIPVNTFAGTLKKTYRFSTSRLNSTIEQTQEFSKKVEYGLSAQYFEIPTFASPTAKGNLIGERIDKQINFSWGEYELFPGTQKDGVWVEWSGIIKSNYTGIVNFEMLSDEGVKVSIDNSLLIDEWDNQSLTKFTGSLSLVKDKWYPIKIEYYESSGNAEAKFSWKYDSMSEYTLVPYTNFLPFKTNYNGTDAFYSKSFSIKEPSNIERKGEILEIPIIFDQDKLVKETYNMSLLNGSKELLFTLSDVVKNPAGYITYAKLIFVDDYKASEEKSYSLVFSNGIYNYISSASVDINSTGDYVTIKNDIYELYFKKSSAAGYARAYYNGGSEIIGENSGKNFYFSAINGSDYTDWAALTSFEIVEDNPVFKEIHYTVTDSANLLKYKLKAKYYYGSSIVKHTVEVTNVSTKSLYSYMGGYAPKIETTNPLKNVWGIASDGTLATLGYTPEANKYLATGASLGGLLGLHSLNGVANFDTQGIMINHDGEGQVLKPLETSTPKEFWMTIGPEEDGYTKRMLNAMQINIADQFNILQKPNIPVITPSINGIVNPMTPITFLANQLIDQNGRVIVNKQWEGLSTNNLYTGGSHTIKLRVQNELGIWSDWASYTFVVKINVLEVYPVGAQLSNMLTSISQTGINVSTMSMDNFNANQPNLSAYDVIIFGFGDKFRSKDISDFMADKVQKFINAGGGVIFTHDTMETTTKRFYTYFSNYLKLTSGGSAWTATSVTSSGSSNILKYPHVIPSSIGILSTTGQPLTSGSEVAAYYGTTPSTNWYLTSNKNVAYINSGQSIYNASGTLIQNLSAAPINEKKLIVNTIFAVSSFRESIESPVVKIQTDKVTYHRNETMKMTSVLENAPNGAAQTYAWEIEELFGAKRIFSYSTPSVNYLIPLNSNVDTSYKIRHYIIDILGVKSQIDEKQISIINEAPYITSFTHTTTKEGALYKVDFTTLVTDPENDSVTLQWENKNTYYTTGEHTVRVRAIDSFGAASTWKTIFLKFE